MSRELKKYQLKATRKPSTRQARLASTVQVLMDDGRAGYCYVSFSDDLVRRVGVKLKGGVSERNPAFLRVEYSPSERKWFIGAQYITGGDVAILWTTTQAPEWLRFYPPRKRKAQP